MDVSIVPRPESLLITGGVFAFGDRTSIKSGEGCSAIARLLQNSLRPATGLDFPILDTAHETDAITLSLDPAIPPSGYRITITPSGANLTGGDGAGLFHATQTFLQLCPPDVFRSTPVPGTRWELPGVDIEDAPRFGWRGMMLDVSRHFFGRKSILKIIDALALHRLNVLHLHLTDDQGWRPEIRRYPRLTTVGSRRARSAIDNNMIRPEGQEPEFDHSLHDGYLSQDDLREIVAYAQARYITVVPEINLPGHSQAAIAAYPELGNTGEQLEVWTDWGVSPHVLNVDDTTIEFYKNVLDEILEIFPGDFIHIGGDECPRDEWRASPAAQARMRELGLIDEDELQSWMTGTFANYLADRGRRLIGWDEIMEGGLPPGASVMSWRGIAAGVAAAEAGHDVVMAPVESTYIYQSQTEDTASEPMGALPRLLLQTVFEFDPIPAGLSPEAQGRILGAQCQMWTEFITSERQMHQMAFPRFSAFAEAVWRRTPSTFDDFQQRLTVHADRLHALDIDGYRPPPAD
jgi:hexosaminidase